MLKKLISGVIVSLLAISMVGCSTEKKAKEDAQATLIEQQLGIKSENGTIVEANKNDGILVVKVQHDNQQDAKWLAKAGFNDVYEFTQNLNLDDIKEIQYWATMPDNEGKQTKVISFTIQQYELKQMKTLALEWHNVNQMASAVHDFWMAQGVIGQDKIQVLFTNK